MSKFTDRLKFLKKSSGKTQAEIAKAIDITPQALSYYMNGREPNFEILMKLANYFRVTTDYLIGLTDVPTPEQADFAYSAGLTDKAVKVLADNPMFVSFLNYLTDIDYSQDFIDALIDLFAVSASPQKNDYILEAEDMGAKVTPNLANYAMFTLYHERYGVESGMDIEYYNKSCIDNERVLFNLIRDIENRVKTDTAFLNYMHRYYDPYQKAYKEKYNFDEFILTREQSNEAEKYFDEHPEELEAIYIKMMEEK